MVGILVFPFRITFKITFFFIKKPLLLLILLALVLVTVVSHAEKHKHEAEEARSCIEKNGPDLVVRTDNKAVSYCVLPSGKGIGVVVKKFIDGKWQEITSYINHTGNDINTIAGLAEQDSQPYGWISFIKDCYTTIKAFP